MMNKKEIFRKIGTIVSELNEQYQYLSANPESLNDLELELFSANSDFLAEHVKVLKKLSNTSEDISIGRTATAENVGVRQVIQEEQVPAPEPVNVQLAETSVNAKPAEPTPLESENISLAERVQRRIDEISLRTPVLKEESEEVNSGNFSEVQVSNAISNVEATVVEQEVAPVIKEVVIPEKIAVIDFPSEVPDTSQSAAAVPTINDIISAQRSQPAPVVSPLVNAQPIHDLKSVISLNDKLLFIKDLFNGYSLAYSEAIELVNRFDSFEAADNFLKANYAAKNNWVSKQSTVDKFYELLNRRFSI